jgi:polar amino acid transport system substrate-binding protein
MGQIQKLSAMLACGIALELLTGMSALASDAAAMVPQEVRDRGTLTVGSQQTFPPVEFKKPDETEVSGVSADLLREIARRLDLELEYIHGEYASLIPGLASKRFDMASGGIGDTEAREETVDFVNFLFSGGGILVRGEDKDKYHTLEDFCGRRISILLGSNNFLQAMDEVNQKCATKFEIEQLPSAPDARAQLDLGRVDGYIGDLPALVYFVSNAPGNYAIVGGNYMLRPYVMSWAFAKDNTALRDAVQKVTQEMLDDGSYKTIITNWGMEGGAIPEITVNLPMSKRN